MKERENTPMTAKKCLVYIEDDEIFALDDCAHALDLEAIAYLDSVGFTAVFDGKECTVFMAYFKEGKMLKGVKID